MVIAHHTSKEICEKIIKWQIKHGVPTDAITDLLEQICAANSNNKSFKNSMNLLIVEWKSKPVSDNLDNLKLFFDEVKDTFQYLAGRWEDEKEHEDIGEYLPPLQVIAKKHNVKIQFMRKKPFGFVFICDCKGYKMEVTKNSIIISEYQPADRPAASPAAGPADNQ